MSSDSVPWTVKMRVAKWLHDRINRLAWRYACEPGPVWGRASRVKKGHPLWRLNDWIAPYWSEPWLRWHVERSRMHHLSTRDP